MADQMSSPADVPAELRAKYEAAGQGHVFTFVDAGKVTRDAARGLITYLSSLDLTHVCALWEHTMADAAAAAAAPPAASKLTPCHAVSKTSTASPSDLASWHATGLDALAHGRAAGLVLAGGQGTRLGSDAPKGEYDIRLPSHRPLFRLQMERMTRVRELASESTGVPVSRVRICVYIMTSPMTDAETRKYFKEHDFFGYPPEDVMFFCQGTLPCMTMDGKIMLESGATVAQAPDGNGGIYRALHISGVIADMKRRGVVGVHVFAVDNAVVRAADPVFLGYCLSRGADVGSKVCPKTGPHEKVGVLCMRDGAYTVVEYSEMDKATAEMRDDSGELVFNAGNLCIHYYSTEFLETKCSLESLPKVYHVARKAIPYAHPETGKTLTKEEMAGKGNTGIKLESFIFDVFPAAKNMAVLEIKREEEFSPVKNAPGSKEDSPDTARDLVMRLHAKWLQAAGVTLLQPDGTPLGPADSVAGWWPSDIAIEVSPLVSYAGENLRELLGGRSVQLPALIVREGENISSAAAAVNVLKVRMPTA